LQSFRALNKDGFYLFSVVFNSWFHIVEFGRESQNLLIGAVCGSAFTFQKNHLHIPLSGAREWQSLHFSVQAPLPFVTLEANLPQPRHKVAVLTDLTGKIITEVAWHKNDRQLLLTLNDGVLRILIRLYGINGNVLLFGTTGNIIASFKKVKKAVACDPHQFESCGRSFPDAERFADLLNSHPDQSLETFLNKSMQPVLPKTFITELCFLTDLNPKTLLINLNAGQTTRIAAVLGDLVTALAKPAPRIYLAGPPVFSLLELDSLAKTESIGFSAIITAQNQFIQTFLSRDRFAEKRKALNQQAEILLATASRKLIRQQNDLAGLPTSANYREWADTLMTAAPAVPAHSGSVTLPILTGMPGYDVTDSDLPATVTIPLDPKLSAIANAQRYYAKSRQIEASRRELAGQIAETEESIRRYSALKQRLSNATDFKELRAIGDQLPGAVRSDPAGAAVHQPFTRIVLEGWEILIGKSARDNDELTAKIARPHDFWLHAQGTTGSHVIVRNPGKVAALPGHILQKAARLAAFYSKAKHSAVVPVAYTQSKYVSKPRQAAAGAVAIKFEKSLIVEPLDPKKLL